jgi:predicted MPP superfamily phosphohydrolase
LRRYHFIGDVHGMKGALDALMDALAPQAGDVAVFLGDLVDRGPDSPGVVRAVRDMAENAAFDVVLIEGNHEELHRRCRSESPVDQEQRSSPKLRRLSGRSQEGGPDRLLGRGFSS